MFEKSKTKWFQTSQAIRFAIIGCFNALVAYLNYAFFVYVLGQECYQISLALAWIISSVTSFFAHRFLVFQGRGNIFKEYLKCALTWVVAYFINAFLLEFFVKNLNFNPYLAQVIAPIIAGIFTFIVFKKLAFKKK